MATIWSQVSVGIFDDAAGLVQVSGTGLAPGPACGGARAMTTTKVTGVTHAGPGHPVEAGGGWCWNCTR